jgi:hypothetical protein
MSATGAAAALSPDSTANGVPAGNNAANSTALTQLLADLDAHSLALVPYRAPRAELSKPADATQATAQSIALWILTTILLAVIFSAVTIQYLSNERTAQTTPTPVIARATAPASDARPEQLSEKQFAALANSVAQLTSAYTDSSERMSRIEAGQTEIQQAQPDSQPSPGLTAKSTKADELATRHHHDSITGLEMIPGAVEHRKANGAMDYWLAPRAAAGSTRLIKVRPFEPSRLGVWIHSLEDGEDYILTPAGGWLKGGAAF